MSPETRAAADRLIARYPQPRSAALPLLYLVQAEHGYITAEGIAFCAEKLELTKAEVQAVQTFYEMYEREPVGDWLITVCTNFSCKVRGAREIYERLLERNGGHRDDQHGIGVKHLECLGNCDDAPVVQVNYQNYRRCTVERAEQILEACRRGDPPPATDGRRPPTFREVSWRLAGADDDPLLHRAAVRGAEADLTAREEPPGQRVLDEDLPIGSPGVRDPGPQVGDTDEPPAALDGPPPLPDEDKGPYPGDVHGQWGKGRHDLHVTEEAKELAEPGTDERRDDADIGERRDDADIGERRDDADVGARRDDADIGERRDDADGRDEAEEG